MLKTIKGATLEGVLANAPVELTEAVIIEAPPDLKIMLKSNKKLPIPKEIIIVAERLTRYNRITNVPIENELKVGDEVMVAILQGGQFFYIMDRAIKY